MRLLVLETFQVESERKTTSENKEDEMVFRLQDSEAVRD